MLPFTKPLETAPRNGELFAIQDQTELLMRDVGANKRGNRCKRLKYFPTSLAWFHGEKLVIADSSIQAHDDLKWRGL